MKKRFMVVGGNFINKGAQAMTFVAVSELRKRIPDCIIHMYSSLDYRMSQKNLSFQVYDDSFFVMSKTEKMKYLFIASAKAILARPKALKSFFVFYMNRKRYSAVIDISGYGLSSDDEYRFTELFCKPIEIARENDVPMFLMSQSFGPLDFSKEYDETIKQLLHYPEKIFAREKTGYDLLVQKYNLDNVVQAYDIVLQCKSIKPSNIYIKNVASEEILHDYIDAVAIVPNMRNFLNADDEDQTLQIYIWMVRKFLNMGKKVYLLRHSHEDIVACKAIKEYFKQERVVLFEKEMSCFEYQKAIAGFNYIVASRYHSVVHAYKEGVPCIVLGWADKYEEIANIFEQDRYVFDIRRKINKAEIDEIIEYMNENYNEERNRILEALQEIQKENAFDYIFDFLNFRGV